MNRLTVAVMQIFPDGRSALAKDYNAADGQLFMLDLASGGMTPVFDFPVVEAHYAAGYLVYVRADGWEGKLDLYARQSRPRKLFNGPVAASICGG